MNENETLLPERLGPDVRHTNVLGCELRYLRGGHGPTVVLLHTLRTQLEYFFPLVHALDLGFEIVVPDLPGHGRSTAPSLAYTATYFTDAMAGFLEACDLRNVLLVGESIGASIGLALAARRNPRLVRVVAINPYDYGRGGGIRRSSALANVLFTAMLWPGVGELVLRTGTKGILRRVMEGGVHDPRRMTLSLVNELWQCGSLPGHPRAFLSLCRNWRTWIAARAAYAAIEMPVTVAYGEYDWSWPEDREANRRALPAACHLSLDGCGHFSCLEQPPRIARIIREEVSRMGAA
jgi:pimeloyl-ACP methyl ester carboxylesterase